MDAKKPNFAFAVAYNASRRLLAVVLLLSGVSKLFSLNSFASEVQQYSELYVGSVFVSWSGVIAFAVFCIEIVLGMDLSFARTSAIASMGVLVLMTFFLYLTGVNYLFPTVLGSVESCGCFGELIHFSAKGSFIKSLLLWIISVASVLAASKCNREFVGNITTDKSNLQKYQL